MLYSIVDSIVEPLGFVATYRSVKNYLAIFNINTGRHSCVYPKKQNKKMDPGWCAHVVYWYLHSTMSVWKHPLQKQKISPRSFEK